MVDIVDGNLLDIGYGMPVELSSTYPDYQLAPHHFLNPPHFLLPAYDPQHPFFKTDVEESPSITVDLLTERLIHRIRIFNEELEYLSIPLSVHSSADGSEWVEVGSINTHFGGKVTNTAFVLLFKYFIRCRFIRVQAKRTRLQLHYIEICAPLPAEYLGRLRNLRVTPAAILADYWHHDSFGFAWTFTCTLSMIMSAQLLGITIDRIDYRLCLPRFKDVTDQDAYEVLFQKDCQSLPPTQLVAFEMHGVYSDLALNVLRQYADHYFSPSEAVKVYAMNLLMKYGLQPSKMIVLLYRGTDKAIEVTPAPPTDYAAVARCLIRADPDLAVVVQTDQAQARDTILAQVPGAIWFDEMPVTEGSQAIHNLDVNTVFGLTRSDLAVQLLGMMLLVSQAKYVITHTGNLAAWVAVYRGHSEGLYQFCADGRLRAPTGSVVTTDLQPAP